jgi:hypothetical protein
MRQNLVQYFMGVKRKKWRIVNFFGAPMRITPKKNPVGDRASYQ